MPGRGQWVWVRGANMYCRRESLSVPWDEERRACRIESRRLRKVDLHTRLVAEYEAAISEVAEEQWFSAGVEQEALSAMRIGASGEVARVGRLAKALGLINACRAGVRERSNQAGRPCSRQPVDGACARCARGEGCHCGPSSRLPLPLCDIVGLAPIRFPDLAGPYLGQSVGGGSRHCGPSSRLPLPHLVTLGFPVSASIAGPAPGCRR